VLVLSQKNPCDLCGVSDDLLVSDQLEELKNRVGALAIQYEAVNSTRVPNTTCQTSDRIFYKYGQLQTVVVSGSLLVFQVSRQLQQADNCVYHRGFQRSLQVQIIYKKRL
jgi:hypothetical protein